MAPQEPTKSISALPSASWRCAPSARSMISGSPPTERNERTGLFTPPTSTRSPRAKISRDFFRLRSGDGSATSQFPSEELDLLQPACCVLGMIREDDVGAGALNRGEDFEDGAFFLKPFVSRRCLDHGIFAAHVVRRH